MNRRSKIRGFSAALVSFLFLFSVTITPTRVQAAEILNRTVQLSSSFIGEVVEHRFSFDTQGTSTIGSIGFQYCTNSPLFTEPCTPPAGMDVSGASLATQLGITGFSVSGATTPTNFIITRAPASSGATSAIFTVDDVTNPTTPDEIVYVRISLFDGSDGTGTRVDQGSVVFVTEDRFDVSAYVPPYMTFCVAVTVALNCSSATGFLADFGEFSTAQATAVTSQFSVATNDPSGYNAFINGQTMTSGTNIIPALATQTASTPGTSQFGINLRANSAPSVGANPNAGPVANGAPAANYNVPNQFRFVNGDLIARSLTTTGFNRYTVSYIVNINPSQAAGIYATTFTYTAVASF